MAFLKRLFPFLNWFERFNATTMRSDFVAGVTVALVLIPQSMAYAQLAGLPPYYGLYAAFLPPPTFARPQPGLHASLNTASANHFVLHTRNTPCHSLSNSLNAPANTSPAA